jgi:NAD(P)-dependent dehydrogenase (short-subunit alcohol dehydrogenase family)
VIELRGATAVVTGGGSGIGRALVLRLAAEGCNVVVADISAGDAADVAAEALALGVRALALADDVTDRDAMDRLAERAVTFGGGTIDVVCLNAGVLAWGSASESSVDDWRWLFDVNVMGVVHGVTAFLDRLLAQATPAQLVITASSAALRPGAGLAAYSASKGAVLALTEALHAQLDGTNVGATALIPSNVESRILDAQRHRSPAHGPKAAEPLGTAAPGVGIDASHVADAAIDAMREGRLYAFAAPAADAAALADAMALRHEALLHAIQRGAVPPSA